MIKLMGLWINEKDGRKYMSGSLGGIKVLVFKNDYKVAGDNQPDYQVYVVENEKKAAPAEGQAQQGGFRGQAVHGSQSVPGRNNSQPQYGPPPPSDDTIPF